MADESSKNNLFWGIVLIIIGALFLLDNFYIMDFWYLISTYWPVILILIGIKIILDRRRATDVAESGDFTSESKIESDTGRNIGSLSESNVFGDINIKIESSDFSGGSVNNVFGDIRLDLSGIKLSKDITKVFVNGIFGDITITVPMGTTLKVKTSAVAGDLKVNENKRDGIMPTLEHEDAGYGAATQKLYLQASVVFGTVSIISQ